MIKKIKVASIFVNEEKSITSKKDGKVYNLCEANVKVADDCKAYAGKYIKMSFFEDIEKKRSALSLAEYYKAQNNEKEVYIDVTEQKYVNKDGVDAVSLVGKKPSKAKLEAYLELLEEMGK
jgi:hypothetical protein